MLLLYELSQYITIFSAVLTPQKLRAAYGVVVVMVFVVMRDFGIFYPCSQIRCPVPPILQHCRQYCNVHALIASTKLHRNLEVAIISMSTNLLISILSRQIFADKDKKSCRFQDILFRGEKPSTIGSEPRIRKSCCKKVYSNPTNEILYLPTTLHEIVEKNLNSSSSSPSQHRG